MPIRCETCPLRDLEVFEKANQDQIAFLQRFKTGELQAEAGSDILAEGAASAHLFTVLSGMGLRYKLLEDGTRQVVSFVLPGDFIGLQSGIMGEMKHSVAATTAMRLCVFNRSELWSLFKHHPERAFDITHLAVTEEHVLGKSLSAVGQLDGVAKVAWLLHEMFHRLRALGEVRNGGVPLPYRQQDVADALGLSLVHTNKCLAKLRSAGVLEWSDGRLVVFRDAELSAIARIAETAPARRPLI